MTRSFPGRQNRGFRDGLALLFTLTGFLQMYVWAVKKHKGYLKTYGDEYKKLHRKAIIPFLL